MIAKNEGHPIYLVGGFGGAARQLAHAIEEKDASVANTILTKAMTDNKYKALFELYKAKGENIDYSWIDSLTISNLNNGLTDEENKRLFNSVNVMEIVSLVLKGLFNKL